MSVYMEAPDDATPELTRGGCDSSSGEELEENSSVYSCSSNRTVQVAVRVRPLLGSSEKEACLETLFEQKNLNLHAKNNKAFTGLATITEQVKALMHKVETYSAPISQLRASLAKSGRPRSERLQSTIAEQENLLRTFIQEIDQTKDNVDGQRRQLLPSLDSEAKRNSMQSAYKRSMSTG